MLYYVSSVILFFWMMWLSELLTNALKARFFSWTFPNSSLVHIHQKEKITGKIASVHREVFTNLYLIIMINTRKTNNAWYSFLFALFSHIDCWNQPFTVIPITLPLTLEKLKHRSLRIVSLFTTKEEETNSRWLFYQWFLSCTNQSSNFQAVLNEDEIARIEFWAVSNFDKNSCAAKGYKQTLIYQLLSCRFWVWMRLGAFGFSDFFIKK